ncbi:MAG TPA: hypothetical protein VGN97_12175 [Mesorhizobium sp.]|jgi:hypothetical protein|nr:hypothetical protein [Mesorhizobium sp.]
MADLLNAIFYSFWTFAGTLLLLSLVVRGLVALCALIVGMTIRLKQEGDR